MKFWLILTITFAAGASASLAKDSSRETSATLAVKRASPCIVNIHTEKNSAEKKTVFESGATGSRKVTGMGTGVIIDDRGYIVTNYHVVAEVDLIRCSLQDGSDYEARVLNHDREHDLAVVKIDPTRPIAVMPCGTSSDLMLAETVLAIGNAYGYRHTVTLGVVSALGRDVEVNANQSYKNLIQTDASINPGNSGGPLINLDGEIIGINVAIRAQAQRIGFAIPIDDVRQIVAKLISVEQIGNSLHGLTYHDVNVRGKQALVIDSVIPDSPAAAAGLRAGDIVSRIGTIEIQDGCDLERALLGKAIGENIEIVVQRDHRTETSRLALAARQGGRMPVAETAEGVQDAEGERFWDTLGIRVAPLHQSQRNLVGPKYRGGMRILDVRQTGPASQSGIRRGDILVGLNQFETVTPENVSWILKESNSEQHGMKFFIIRGQETLFGFVQVASSRK